MKYNLFLALAVLMVLGIGVVSAEGLGTFKRGNSINLLQSCENSTYANITRLVLPNSTLVLDGQHNMTKTGDDYYYRYTPSESGTYLVYGICDENLDYTKWAYDFEVTESGDSLGIPQTVIIFGQLGIMALFFVIGLSFSQEKWKMRTFFFLSALLMAVITLNSIRIASGVSNNLTSMGNVGFILGIVVLLVMFVYNFIYYTLEVFRYFKEKRRMKWSVGTSPL